MLLYYLLIKHSILSVHNDNEIGILNLYTTLAQSITRSVKSARYSLILSFVRILVLVQPHNMIMFERRLDGENL